MNSDVDIQLSFSMNIFWNSAMCAWKKKEKKMKRETLRKQCDARFEDIGNVYVCMCVCIHIHIIYIYIYIYI